VSTPSVLFLGALLGLLPSAGPAPADPTFRAGAAARVITPDELLWMAGYAARDHPAEGKLQDLYVKALALEDPSGGKLVLLTSDLIGLPRELSEAVAGEVQRRSGLPRERLLLTCSHTHCGPVLRGSLADMYPLTPEQWRQVNAYTDRLRERMVETIRAALDDLKPARLAAGKGTARFAANRRTPKGPVDHDVPVLRVETPDGKLRAVVFGYACHNTTLQFYRWCGDYAGFAQAYFEQQHPGATALFWSGCGGDANPQPRGTVELCEQHGRELAEAVNAVLARPMTPLAGRFTARYATVALPFASLPSKQKWTADLQDKNPSVRRRAARFLKTLEAGGRLGDRYPAYPIQVWRLGDNVLWIALGGEVVIDYALRLKRELAGTRPVWVTAYANDVMAYIPSERVLREGGYEGDTSMIYYGMPTKWAPGVEEVIAHKTEALVEEVGKGRRSLNSR
jgi:hypothetical protein